MKQKSEGKNRRRIGVRTSVFISFAVFTVVIIGLLWLFQIVFLESFYKKIKTNDIVEASSYLAKNINNDSFSAIIEDVADSREMCIIICDTDGNILYSVEKINNCQIHRFTKVQRAEIAASTIENGGVFVETIDINPRLLNDKPFDDFDEKHKPNLFQKDEPIGVGMIYSQVTNNGNRDLIIILNSQITPVESTVNTLKIQLIIISAWLILISALLSVIVSRSISKPIERTNASAKKLAEADYDIRFREDGYKEIAELSQTLNYAAAELGKTDALRKELIANVSHDLRTPLTLIAGYGEVMRDLPGENTPENVQIIIDETSRLTALVNDMLDVSKLESNTVTLSLDKYNLTSDIRNIIDRYSLFSRSEGFSIDFEYDREVFVSADELKITQVIYNLVNNAINYCGDDKAVIVRQSIVDDFVRIDVIDHGKGIDKDSLKHIWDRYYKSSETHNRGIIGTGLGLSIVKGVLELHHAEYGIESEYGKGSDFWFKLLISK